MEWWEIGVGAGVIAFIMAAITLLADWVMQYWLVIRWGPNVTKKLVIDEFKNKDTARTVREALDLPTRGEVLALKDELRAKDLAFGAALDVRMGGLKADIQNMIPKPLDLSGLKSEIITAVDDTAKKVISGHMGAAAKAKKAEFEDFTQQYMQSQFYAYDQKWIYTELTKRGVAPGMSQFVATSGPPAVEWLLKQVLGEESAGELMGSIAAARAAIPQAQGVGQSLYR